MNIKTLIIQHCKEKLQGQILEFESSLKNLRTDSQSESKSSMGDKFETSKAMIQIEIDKTGRQLQLLQSQAVLLNSLDDTPMQIARTGALVMSTCGNFYLSVPLGRVLIGDLQYVAISESSPMGLAMKNLKKGSSFHFNANSCQITDIL